MSNNPTISSSAISLPKGGGALSGIGEKFSPDLFTGTGNFTIPIALPSGRNGFQPQLNLVYSTGTGNGPFGLGWNLSIPGVSRKTSNGVPRYNEDAEQIALDHNRERRDVFILSGAEDLVQVDGEYPGRVTYRPRTEGLFAKIEHVRDATNNYWEVHSIDGLVSFYGTTVYFGNNPATIADPSNLQHIFAWKLRRTQDAFNNRIEYVYERDTDEAETAQWNQLNLKQICYVDYGNDPANPNIPQFLVKVEFNYDLLRPDPHSSYRAGFEIPTSKRCTNIVVHTLTEENRLVRTYNFIYLDQRVDEAKRIFTQIEDASHDDPANASLIAQRNAARTKYESLLAQLPLNGVSLLSQVTVTGHDGDATEMLPPLEFRYTIFEPAKTDFIPLQGSNLPANSLAGPDLEMVDLFGRGLPDLIEINDTVRYWRNLGGGLFDLPRFMSDAPAGIKLSDKGVQLVDTNGDGRADLLVTTPTIAGYYPLRFNGQWDRNSFKRYLQAPTFDLKDSEVKLVDLDGDGVTDAIRSGNRLECYFNDPAKGWDQTHFVERQTALADFPNVSFSDPRVKWGDFTGEGMQTIAMVTDGNVVYWPHLGRGKWGKRIQMRHSPRFPFGYDPKRILVGDVDGDGLADIVYVENTKVTLWINQSGNAWSDPIDILGTPPISDIDAVRLVDILGSGISGVLWSRDAGSVSQNRWFFFDFTGGRKPYLLHEMDNHIGALTKVEYAPSTHFFLKDQHQLSTRWKTTLPFPVQVVSRVEVIDYFSRSKHTSEYCYHHGYWDGGEREFRGFGLVEQYDSELFNVYDSSGLHGDDVPFAKVEPKYFSPPTLSRTWFHLGPVGDEYGMWEELNWSDQYWFGDPQILKHTESINQYLGNWSSTDPNRPDRRIRRDALRALRGSILRSELYALDSTEIQENRPYTVTESRYALKEFSPPADGDPNRLRIFFPHLISKRTTQWERGDDPLTQFLYTRYKKEQENQEDEFDPYGRPLAQIQIACPRGWRNVDNQPAEPYLATISYTVYGEPSNSTAYIHNRIAKVTTYELLNTTEQRILELATTKEASPQLKIISQNLSFYDGDAFVGMPLGQVGEFGAVTRSESLVFTEDLLRQAYGEEFPPYLATTGEPEWNDDYPLEFRTLLSPRAGYSVHGLGDHPSEPEGYFVNVARHRYDFQTHEAQPGRGLLLETLDPLHDSVINPSGHRTLIAYDKYQFLPEKVTDAAGLTVQATYDDYRVLQPSKVTDANGNISRFTFTPLGLLESSFIGGKTNTEGDLDRPSIRMEYGFLAFENSLPENPQPIFVRTVRRVHHDTELDVLLPERDETITTVEYSDGFGRLLQTRTQGEEVRFGDEHFGGGENILPAVQGDGAGGDVLGRRNTNELKPNVVVSGWQVYDNKGQVVEKYEPFFSEGWDYDQPNDSKTRQKVEIFYDPRGHTIRTLNPDGSEQRVIFGVPGTIAVPNLAQPDKFEPTPWEAYTYDANDNAGRTHPVESINYQHHWNTPASILIDALGRTIKAVERNRDAPANPGGPPPLIKELVTQMTYDIRGNVLSIIDALARVAFQHVYDYGNHVLRIDSIDAGVRKTVLNAMGSTIEQRDSKKSLILRTYDALNRPLQLWARDDDSQVMRLRERLEYGDGGTADQDDAERLANRTTNRLGRLIRYLDEAGELTFESYDFKGNVLEKSRKVVSDAAILSVFDGPPPEWKVEAYRVDWTTPVPLEAKLYTSTVSYDALNRMKLLTYPEDVERGRRKLKPHYNRAGALERIVLELVGPAGEAISDTFIERIAYNAKGQRVLIAYGNGIMTRYAYDQRTFRLIRMRTEAYSKPSELGYRHTGETQQEFAYEFDLVGNILKIQDRTPGCGIRNTFQGVDALDRTFNYDAIYRLRSATGRECNTPQDVPWDDGLRCIDITQTRAYTQQYEYDMVGNIETLKHLASDGGFTREFTLIPENNHLHTPKNNRLDTLSVRAAVLHYEYDTSGNLIREATSRHFEWDYVDRMRVYRTQTEASEPSVYAHYLYDGGGQRVKKLVRKQGGQIEVTLYIDGIFEYQSIVKPGSTEENNTLHVMDNKSRIALVRIGNAFAHDATPAVKYHLGDHLSSSNVVMDGLGNFINREEYTPYGETSFGSFARKRYRFSGKERDEESGLNYHGARYLATWLGRWTSCDPAGIVEGVNLYRYSRSNPMSFSDPKGTDAVPSGPEQDANMSSPELHSMAGPPRPPTTANLVSPSSTSASPQTSAATLQATKPDSVSPEKGQPEAVQSSADLTEEMLYRDLETSNYSGESLDRLLDYYKSQFDWEKGNLQEDLLKRATAFATAAGGQMRQGDNLSGSWNGAIAFLDVLGVTITGRNWKETCEKMALNMMVGGVLGTLSIASKGAGSKPGFVPSSEVSMSSQGGWRSVSVGNLSAEETGLIQDIMNANEIVLGRSTNVKGGSNFVLDTWLEGKGITWSQRWQDVYNRGLFERTSAGRPVNIMSGGGYTRGETIAAEAGARVSGIQNKPYWP